MTDNPHQPPPQSYGSTVAPTADNFAGNRPPQRNPQNLSVAALSPTAEPAKLPPNSLDGSADLDMLSDFDVVDSDMADSIDLSDHSSIDMADSSEGDTTGSRTASNGTLRQSSRASTPAPVVVVNPLLLPASLTLHNINLHQHFMNHANAGATPYDRIHGFVHNTRVDRALSISERVAHSVATRSTDDSGWAVVQTTAYQVLDISGTGAWADVVGPRSRRWDFMEE